MPLSMPQQQVRPGREYVALPASGKERGEDRALLYKVRESRDTGSEYRCSMMMAPCLQANQFAK